MPYLCIKGPFVIWYSSSILCYNNKIGCRSILRSRITPFLAQLISCTMVSVMVGINNEPSSVFPDSIPASICYSSTEYHTSFVNTDIIWMWFEWKNPDPTQMRGRGLGCGCRSPGLLSILHRLLPVPWSAPTIHPASSGLQVRGGAGHAGSHGLPPPSWSSLFHPQFTPWAVAREAGRRWCIVLVSVKILLVTKKKKREKKNLPGAPETLRSVHSPPPIPIRIWWFQLVRSDSYQNPIGIFTSQIDMKWQV